MIFVRLALHAEVLFRGGGFAHLFAISILIICKGGEDSLKNKKPRVCDE